GQAHTGWFEFPSVDEKRFRERRCFSAAKSRVAASPDRFQPARKFPDDFLTRVIGPPNNIEAISRQRHVECLDQLARCKLGCHEHIAEKAKALARNYGFDRMQLFPEAQMLHVLELGNVAPFLPGKRE